jgi:hypothetical protein
METDMSTRFICTLLQNKRTPICHLLVVDSWQLERVSEINPGHPWCFVCICMAGIYCMEPSKMAVLESLRSYWYCKTKAINRLKGLQKKFAYCSYRQFATALKGQRVE